MADAEFFCKFGFYINRNFINSNEIDIIRSEVLTSEHERATVRKKGKDYVVDEDRRKTYWSFVSSQTLSNISDKLTKLIPEIKTHFQIELENIQTPQFLIYNEGDFFDLHTDTTSDKEAADNVKKRTISSIIFLNSESNNDSPDTFSGGSLTFYDLLKGPANKSIGFPLKAEEGLLIAFRSNIKHEVTKITRGRRFTIVSWYY